MSVTSPVLLLGASLAAGLMIGVERGWRLRGEASGSRVAGVRTYSLLGTAGGVSALLGQLIHPLVALALVAALSIGLVIGYWRGTSRRDATSFVTAIVALALGMLAGAGQPALAVPCAAIRLPTSASTAMQTTRRTAVCRRGSRSKIMSSMVTTAGRRVRATFVPDQCRLPHSSETGLAYRTHVR